MADYDDTNRGAIFQNARKLSEKHPDYTGTLNVGGVEYWLSGWKKTSKKDGKPYLSLSVTLKEEKASTKDDRRGASSGVFKPGDDDIPFIVNCDISPERRFRV